MLEQKLWMTVDGILKENISCLDVVVYVCIPSIWEREKQEDPECTVIIDYTVSLRTD